MVKKIMKFFAYLLFFVLALILFIPKSNLYYLAEANLKKFDVVISNEKLSDNFLSLNIENLDITTKAIDSGVIGEADITLLLFYNSVVLKEIKLSSLVESYLPSKIANLEVSYSILNPLELSALGDGDFGEARASLNLQTRELTLVLKPSKKMFLKYKRSLAKFKKSQNGEYIYAKTF